MSAAYNALQTQIGYQFKDLKLLQLALTHRSCSRENNERLEFLGDGILNFTIAAALYRQYPQVSEGDLSRLRASLVDKKTLVKRAHEIQIGHYIELGGGELKTGGWRRDSILADATEALFGAIYLDGGDSAAQDCILRLYQTSLANMPAINSLKDPKTRLQEALQALHLPIPVYSLVSVEGQAHQQTFTALCEVAYFETEMSAKGSSRRKAEQAAAQAMLTVLSRHLGEDA